MIKKILAIFVLLAFVCGITFFVINVRKKQLMDPWNVWIDKQISYSIKHEKNITKAERDLYRNVINEELTENATVPDIYQNRSYVNVYQCFLGICS